jgi:hypothetical protein
MPPAQARLVEDEGSQGRQISGSAEGAVRPPGGAEQHHRLPSPRRNCLYDRRDVAELAFRGVIGTVPTGVRSGQEHLDQP